MPKWTPITLVTVLALLAGTIVLISLGPRGVNSEVGSTPVITNLPGVDVGNPEAETTDDDVTGRPMVTFLGDSYTSGSRQDSGVEARYPHLVGQALGINVHSAGLGGSGYATEGTARKALPTLINKIHVDSSVIVIFGSRNDKGGYQAVYDAALKMYTNIRMKFPDAQLIVVGPAPVEVDTPQFIIDSTNAVRDAAATAGVTFVDATDWLKGDPSLVGSDNVQPNDAGHAELAAKFQPIIYDALGLQD